MLRESVLLLLIFPLILGPLGLDKCYSSCEDSLFIRELHAQDRCYVAKIPFSFDNKSLFGVGHLGQAPLTNLALVSIGSFLLSVTFSFAKGIGPSNRQGPLALA